MSTYPFCIPSGVCVYPSDSGTNDLGKADYTFKTIYTMSFSGIPFGEMYMIGNLLQTVITGINSPVQISGLISAGTLNYFLYKDPGSLIYIGDYVKQFYISASLSLVTSNGANITFAGFLAKNDQIIQKTKASSRSASAANEMNLSCQGMVTLGANDTIKLFLQNETSATNIIVKSFNLVIL